MVMSSSRVLRRVSLDAYYSPQTLADYVKTLVGVTLKDVMCVDPCAGNNMLYDVLPEPKRRFDIADESGGLDFFTSSRSTFCSTSVPLALVMNPPFALPKQRNGVIAFLNHGCSVLRDGEFIICVSPHTMRKWTVLRKVSCDLHLLEEHVFVKPLTFVCGSKKHRVHVLLQVWQKRTGIPRVWPMILSSSLDFRVAFDAEADFFIKVWGSLNRLGMVSKGILREEPRRYVTSVGTLAKSKKGGTCIGIFVKSGRSRSAVEGRFEELFASGAWREFMSYKCSGANNPMVTSRQIYTLYECGVSYLRKESYDIKVNFIE